MSKLEFNTTLDDSEKLVRVVIKEFKPYDLSNENSGYTNYSVYLLNSNEEITDDLTLDEEIQISSEAYEYCVDQIGIVDDEEMEELDFE